MATTVAEPALERTAMTPLPYRVTRKRRETSDVWTLELEPVHEAIEPIGPGQFTMLYAFGVGEAPISTSGKSGRNYPLVHTIREAGAVTRALCAKSPGDVVGVRGPFGNTWPLDEARGKDVVVMAGGIGLPPLRPAIYDVLAHRDEFGRLLLLYGGRTPADLLYPTELARWRERGVAVDVIVDAAGPEWTGRVGVVTKLVPGAHFDPENAVAFVVGPEIMMRFSAQALVARGLPADCIWASMERTMRCGIGLCGHCQLGPTLVCRDGAVYPWPYLEPLLGVPEL
ncbi:MAG TPA: FAD/NAD(P)-binding protein [Gaiellaceae bacterium]